MLTSASKPGSDNGRKPDDGLVNGRSLRFATAAIILCLSYAPLRLAFLIPKFKLITADLLEGRQLPLMSQVVFRGEAILLGLALVIPVVTLSTLRMKSIQRSFQLLGLSAMVILLMTILLCQGLFTPLIGLVDTLGQTPDAVEN